MAKSKQSKSSVVKFSPVMLAAIIIVIAIVSVGGVLLYLNWNVITQQVQLQQNQTIQQACNEDNTTCFAAHLKDCSSAFMTINSSIMGSGSISAMAVIKGKQNYTANNVTQEVCGITIAPMSTCTYLIPTSDLQVVPTKDSYSMLIYIVGMKVNTNC